MKGIDWRLGIATWLALPGLAAVLPACGDGDGGISLQTSSYDLDEVNNSSFSGEAWLVSGGDNRTVVVVAVGEGEQPRGDFPVAIQRSR